MLTRARWTHLALPVADLDASLAWYLAHTPLALVAQHDDHSGRNVWLAQSGDPPFVLVLVMFNKDRGRKQPLLTPFAHIGIELPRREDVIASADAARAAGCLVWEPKDLPPPVGFVCAAADPDGNLVELSHDQRVLDRVEAALGSVSPPATAHVVRGYLDALNRADLDRAVSFVSEDFVSEHTAALGERFEGRAIYRARLAEFLRRFDGLHYDVDDLLVEGGRAVVTYRLHARCAGVDGCSRPIMVRGAFHFEVQDDKITRRADYWDSFDYFRQVNPGARMMPAARELE